MRNTMLTFKTVKGKHIITCNRVERECDSLHDAWKRAFALRILAKKFHIKK